MKTDFIHYTVCILRLVPISEKTAFIKNVKKLVYLLSPTLFVNKYTVILL
jgi:hypothetical protein